jgi:prefoldin subunit 1
MLTQAVSSPLPQLLQEIETRAIASQQQISLTKSQITAKQRDVRMLQLTSKELSELPADTGVYEGVGKM